MTEEPSLKPFFVYAPYCKDEGLLSRRNAIRPKHTEHMARLIESGILRVGGVLSDPNGTGEVVTPVASSMIVKFESLSAVRKMLESDVYWTDNVWDKEKLVVLPYNPAVPLP